MSKKTMNKPALRAIAGALAAAMALGSAGIASAQRHDDRHDDRHDARRDDRHDDRHDWRGDRYDRRDGMRRGAGPNHDIWVGKRLPAQYRSHTYVVDDWRGHRLSSPPRGYHWVQSGGDYLLVAVATGLIASAILNN